MHCTIGIDVGTSGTKTILIDEEGRILATASREYPLHQPQGGWAEQNPEDWWQAARETLRDVMETVDPSVIRGIGLTGQMHGLVLLDEAGAVLRPSIIWCDQRTGQEVGDIRRKMGDERIAAITGNPAVSGFTLAKILWVRKNEPALFAKVRHILLPKDYIRYRLTGAFVTDVSDACGMQLIDIRSRDWSPEVLEVFGLDRDMLPDVVESPEVTGRIVPQEGLEPLEGVSVVGGAGDQAAGAVGNGIVEEGLVSVTVGTSGVAFVSSDTVRTDPAGRVHSFCHAVPGKWHMMGVTQGAGLSLRWFRDQFGNDSQDDGYAGLMAMGEDARITADGLYFLPYMMGERTPHLDPDARGVFFGLTARHGRREMVRAIVEGVTYSLRDCLEVLRELGIDTRTVRVSGGGARSSFWRSVMADAFGNPVIRTNSEEGPAYGAALLAAVGTGRFDTVEDACRATIRPVDETVPDETRATIYDVGYRVYSGLYKSLKDNYRQLRDSILEVERIRKLHADC